MLSLRRLGLCTALLALLCVHPLETTAQEKGKGSEPKKAGDAGIKGGKGLADEIRKSKKLQLTLEKVVQYLLKQNFDVQKAVLDYKGSYSDLKRYQSRYDSNLYGKANYSRYESPPENPQSKFQGSEIIKHTYEVGAARQFSTGTKIQVGVNSLYQNVKGAEINMGPLGTINMGGAGYQSGVLVTLSQEILKNSFGLADRLSEKKIENAAEIKKRLVKQYLSNLLVEALIGYWNVSVAEENLTTTRVGLDSTKEIRDLMVRKLRLGLSEREDLLDWNSKVLLNQNYYDQAGKNLYDARLAVLRTLNLDSKTDFEIGKTFQTTPPDVSFERALKDAYAKRVDLINQKTLLKNAELEYRIASNTEMPSMKLNMSAGNTDYSVEGYSKTFNDVNKQWSVGVEVNYPLGNTEADVRMHDAKLSYERTRLEMKDMEKRIRDEVDSIVKQCDVSYAMYKQTKKSAEFARNYYYQVLAKFRRGRYSAVQLKLALDSYIQMRQSELKSLVDYNIVLLRRDLSRNVIFENFGINVEDILDKEIKKLSDMEKAARD